MRRMICLVLSMAMIMLLSVNSFADENEFDLIDYIENNRIESYSDFVSVIEDNNGNERASAYMHSLSTLNDREEYFRIEVDYENRTVEVDVIYDTTASLMASTRSGAAKHETYSASGQLMYTVTVNGTFTYTSNSCSNTSKSGSFERGPLSWWSSSPTVTSGCSAPTVAYARISGTATLTGQRSTYQLTLSCNTSGTLSSDFTRP